MTTLPLRATARFMGMPGRGEVASSRAAVVGIPFDLGQHPTRIGARTGPAALRDASLLLRRYIPPENEFDPIERLGACDWGDVDVVPSRVEQAFERTEQVMDAILASGARPLTMGGDGCVTLPQLRAVHRKHSDLVVIHLDSHPDTNPNAGYDTGTTFTRAAEERVVEPGLSFHAGLRGTMRMPGVLAKATGLGYQVIRCTELLELGIPGLLRRVRETVGTRPVYLCLDLDFFDPSCAPGVCAPVPGGILAREGLAIIEGLDGLDIVAADINTMSPPHDAAGNTALLGANAMLRCLYLFCAAEK
jgi:agmatinase